MARAHTKMHKYRNKWINKGPIQSDFDAIIPDFLSNTELAYELTNAEHKSIAFIQVLSGCLGQLSGSSTYSVLINESCILVWKKMLIMKKQTEFLSGFYKNRCAS